MTLPLGEGAILGLVQGVTEFLPLSGDGHVALAELLWGGEREQAAAVVLHAGTLAATIAFLRKRAWIALEEGLRGLARPALFQETPGGRDASFVAVATVPSAIVALAVRHRAGASFGSLVLIGACFVATALVVAGSRLAPAGNRATPAWTGAVLVGVAQGAAILPGVSRSGVTIASLLWLGVSAERAFELSFLASIPFAIGAIAFEAQHALRGDESLAALAAAGAAAFVAGTAGIALARRVVVANKMHWLAFYLVPLAVATLAWGYARP